MTTETNEYSTERLKDMAESCGGIEEFEQIAKILQAERPFWQAQIEQIIRENHYTKAANLCGVSGPAVSKWCNGSLPSSRDDFIRIGFAAHYNLDEMNRFLQRYGKYPALYPKSLEDSVYIFVLNSDVYPHTYAFCQETISRISSKMGKISPSTVQICETDVLNEGLMSLTSIEQLETFISENAASYKNAYEKFYKQVIAILIDNTMTVNIAEAGHHLSINNLAVIQGWTSSMRQCVSAIRKKSWFPLRRKVIALGIHLNLTVAQIDNLLSLAHMETLCGKNPVESAIIFAITEAELNEITKGKEGMLLYEYVYRVLTKLEISDAESLLNDLSGF